MRWTSFATFWQLTTDMMVAGSTPAGHGHRYQEELVPAWAGVLGLDPDADYTRHPAGDRARLPPGMTVDARLERPRSTAATMRSASSGRIRGLVMQARSTNAPSSSVPVRNASPPSWTRRSTSRLSSSSSAGGRRPGCGGR